MYSRDFNFFKVLSYGRDTTSNFESVVYLCQPPAAYRSGGLEEPG